jgi:hypothetical protein
MRAKPLPKLLSKQQMGSTSMVFKKKKQQSEQLQRNMPGTTSRQRVNSYYTASKKQITTFQRHTEFSQAKKSYASVLKKYGLITVSVILAVFTLFAMFTLDKSASISIDSGGAYRSPEEYKQIVADTLGKNFQNNLKLSLRTDEIEQDLKKQLPEATNVAVYAPLFGRSPEVIITTAKPFAVVIQTGAPSFVLTDRGRLAIASTATIVDTTKLSTITNNSGTEYKQADQLFKPDEMSSMRDLQFQYTKGTGEGLVAYILPTTPREIQVKEGAYVARFSLSEENNIVQQFGALRAVQGQLATKNSTPKEYIDVRLATKVFIK